MANEMPASQWDSKFKPGAGSTYQSKWQSWRAAGEPSRTPAKPSSIKMTPKTYQSAKGVRSSMGMSMPKNISLQEPKIEKGGFEKEAKMTAKKMGVLSAVLGPFAALFAGKGLGRRARVAAGSMSGSVFGAGMGMLPGLATMNPPLAAAGASLGATGMAGLGGGLGWRAGTIVKNRKLQEAAAKVAKPSHVQVLKKMYTKHKAPLLAGAGAGAAAGAVAVSMNKKGSEMPQNVVMDAFFQKIAESGVLDKLAEKKKGDKYEQWSKLQGWTVPTKGKKAVPAGAEPWGGTVAFGGEGIKDPKDLARLAGHPASGVKLNVTDKPLKSKIEKKSFDQSYAEFAEKSAMCGKKHGMVKHSKKKKGKGTY